MIGKIPRQFLFIGIGLLIAAGGWYFFYASTADLALKVNGEILKVRTHELSEKNILLMTDFRIRNTSSIDFMLKEAVVYVTMADGKELEGQTVTRTDLDTILQYAPQAGVKFNQVLTFRDRVPAKVSIDRMVGATFACEESDLNKRKSIRLHLIDVEGKEFDLLERNSQAK